MSSLEDRLAAIPYTGPFLGRRVGRWHGPLLSRDIDDLNEVYRASRLGLYELAVLAKRVRASTFIPEGDGVNAWFQGFSWPITEACGVALLLPRIEQDVRATPSAVFHIWTLDCKPPQKWMQVEAATRLTALLVEMERELLHRHQAAAA